MSATDGKNLEGITFDYEKNGVQVRKQISKKIISSTGSWATIAFKHQDLSCASGEFKNPRVTIARFKKSNGTWKKQSGFNVNSSDQAKGIIDFLRESFLI